MEAMNMQKARYSPSIILKCSIMFYNIKMLSLGSLYMQKENEKHIIPRLKIQVMMWWATLHSEFSDPKRVQSMKKWLLGYIALSQDLGLIPRIHPRWSLLPVILDPGGLIPCLCWEDTHIYIPTHIDTQC